MTFRAKEHSIVDSKVNHDFEIYLQGIVREWMQVLTMLCIVLIPFFLLLDYYTQPPHLHLRFAIYRGATTVLVIIEYLLIRFTHPNRSYPVHGYIISSIVSLMIVLMTVDLGGFNSSYYAGLMLVLMAVNILLSWRPIHSVINGILTLSIYLGFNAWEDQPFDPRILVNNLFFLGSTIIITAAISWVRFKLVRSEYLLRAELVGANQNLDKSRADLLRARDALWGEMQLAKMIQTALLPRRTNIGHYEVAALMVPTDSVGGDYYDIIDAPNGEKWVGIGDVSGHGVESGLIMMMAQTAIQAIVQQHAMLSPSEVLIEANRVIKENIARLGTDRYMTMMLFRLEDDHLLVAGKHLDLMIYRAQEKKVEVIPTNGSWLGIVDDLGEVLEDHRIPMSPGDIVLLYTDGITEARNQNEDLFGEERLMKLLESNAKLPLRQLGTEIFSTVTSFEENQSDDMTLVLLKNRA
ncbi:PP2C family protein-serine/threonine phosphatase [Leptospira yasudae]|uniref:PP2C family protein-serine/threonine phosphatase n=1 Tax=Leptospira yasudae TaxID=2202201 RepID=UPI0010915B08|nr:PP2C family protein-serine/threonine phosphatase [Leptospira yasudae]MBW0435722.1 PP2C family protein-serine/threonine phosphatase [Leptospira yasudae]TGM96541.1 LacI family transcriptional regulator [Leptospira yasudae]